jgi:ABC-type phosphate transport system substrate-binding protein
VKRRPLAIILVAMAAATATGQDAGFKVIVNATNPASSVPRKEVADIFLKVVTKWPKGVAALPVDQSYTSPIRKRFSKEVLRRTPLSIQSYWQQLIFSGRETPPAVKLTDPEVIAFVEENEGAVGYVSDGAVLGPKAKAVELR